MKRVFELFATTLVLFSSFAISGCDSNANTQISDPNDTRDYINFQFNVSYEGGSNRVDKINKGNKASNWQAKRLGYSLEGWYGDDKFTKLFDFETPLYQDTVVYAKWAEGEGKDVITITFDYNYTDCPQPVVIKTKVGQKVSVDDVPLPSRFGYITTGWYTNPNDKSTKWSFLNDEFTKDTVLYAGYEEDSTITYDEYGEVVFNDVSIDFAPNILSWGGGGYQVQSIVDKFNSVYAGKIYVNIVPYGTTEVATFEDTGFINENLNDYYNVDEVLKSINHPFDVNNYYLDAISENFIAGTLKSVPVSHLVPLMVYNKQILSTLSSNPFPTKHSEIYDLFCEANEQNQDNANWKGALSTSPYEWATYEIGSHAMWSNSNFRFMDYDISSNEYINNFRLEANNERLYNAYVGANRIFGFNSDVNSGYSDNSTSDFVNGNSLACYLGFSSEFGSLRNSFNLNDKAFIQKYGVVAANDLCNYGEYEDAHMFAKGLSIGVKNNSSDLTEVAAAGIFAEFFSNNSASLMSSYAYPAAKSVQNSGEFNQGDFESYILHKAVKPELIYTLPGHKMNYSMYNYFNQNCISAVFNPRTISEESAATLTKSFGNAFQTMLEDR